MKYFSHFRFDPGDRKLWLGSDQVPLTRKAADLLACLVNDAGTTVSHQKLMQSVWPNTHVQQDNIKVLVHEVRHALGDNPASPRFVESESGRGYAFVAAVADAPCPLLEGSGHDHPPLISRDPVLGTIEASLARAISQREPSVVFLEGMAGSGKTTACREIDRRAGKWLSLRTAYGRAHRNGGAPFPAVVAMLERLVARYPALARPILAQRAPTWFAQLGDRSLGVGQEHQPVATVESMAFELVDALGELGQNDAFLLVLEDLHWSGSRVLDLLSIVEKEAIPSRILILATYAPFGSSTEDVAGDMPSATAQLRSRQAPLRLLPLTDVEVNEYLERRFGSLCADALASPIYNATMGHAASVAKVADRLASAGFLRHGVSGWSLGVPLRQVHPVIADTTTDSIRAQLDGLRADERRLLEAAAAAGWTFTHQSVAEALRITNVDAMRDSLDLLAMHLPVFERLSPARAKRPASVASFRFRHRQWFDLLRGHATMAMG